MKEKVVALDGPSGSGKSTLAMLIAEDLELLYVDTGAMFRALGHHMDQLGLAMDDEKAIAKELQEIDLEYSKRPGVLIGINGVDLTQTIRQHHVSNLASKISTLPSVRKFLLDFQRDLAQSRVCIMEGRDIGTIVFPGAFAKFFITATAETRAKRRLIQLEEKGEGGLSFDKIYSDVVERDTRDGSRKHAPMKQAEDAELVETDALNIAEVVNLLKAKIKQKADQNQLSL